MQKRIAIGAGMAVLTAGAFAQTPEPMKPVGVSLRVGAFMPTNSVTKASGKTWLAAGVEYKVMERERMDGTDQVTVSLDFTSKDSFRIVPLLANYVRHTGSVYFTGGVGVAFTRRMTAAGNIQDKARFGYQLGVGYEIPTSQFPLFVEAKYMGNELSELNGFGLFVGVRF